MEKLFAIIKNFILTTVNEELSAQSTTETPLPEISEDAIVFGQIDLSTLQKNICVSVFPESQEEDDGGIASAEINSDFTITFICRNSKYDVLIRQMCRYAEIFRRCVLNDYTLNDDSVENAEIGTRTFYPDAGNTEKQITAVEVKLTLTTDEEIGE